MCNDLCAHCARCEARTDLSPRDRGNWHDAGHPDARNEPSRCAYRIGNGYGSQHRCKRRAYSRSGYCAQHEAKIVSMGFALPNR